jgi:ATP-dependent helicase/nuclease subunit B
MTVRVEQAGRNERINHVLRRLIGEVREKRGLDRITIVTPTNQTSFYIRRSLAKEGLFNVDFKRLEDVAELLAGQDSKQPLLHDLQASEFVYEAALDESLGTKLGGAEVSPQLQMALHSSFRELELLSDSQLSKIASQNDVQRELVKRFEKYMKLAVEYRRGASVAQDAADVINSGVRPDRVGQLGTVLLVEASAVAPIQRPLFDALAGIPEAVKITIDTSPPDIQLVYHPAEDDNHLKPIGVPDVAYEVRSVVREIVNQARDGKRFAHMAVVFEDDSYASRIAEALELAGIPVSGPDRTALSDSPEGRFISGLLDVFENDFSRLDVTAWLSSSPVKDPVTKLPVPASRWDAISRSAGVTASIENSWAPRLERYARNVANRAEHSERLDESGANVVEAAKSDATYARELQRFVVGLAQRMPGKSQDTWQGFAEWLRLMVDEYLVIPEPDPDADTQASNSQYARLITLIERLETLTTTGAVEPKFDHCAGVIREQLARRSAGLRSLGSGVYVGPVWTAAGCPFESIYVLGMSEGRYPSPGLTDPLFPDPLKREIDPEGAHLSTLDRKVAESHKAFISVIESAAQVFMYWPSGIPGESREFGPARWFLDAVREVSGEKLLQAGRLMDEEISGLDVRRRSDSAQLSSAGAADDHEYDVTGARNWVRDGKPSDTFPLSEDVSSIASSVEFESKQRGETWTEYDGKIDLSKNADSSSSNAESTAAQAATVGSATAFETYAACPYRYFLSRRLRIEPTVSPEPEMALDALSFGTLIHDALEQFSLWRIGLFKAGAEEPSKADQQNKLKSYTTAHIEQLKEEIPGRSEGAWRIEESRAWLLLRQWLRRESLTAGLPDMRQIEAEYSFGSETPDSDKGPPVEVETELGTVVKFRGQVDRVDRSEDESRVIVYDYKSGSNNAYRGLDKDPVKKGTKLQLPLYSKAIAHKYPDADISAAYWFVRESGSGELHPAPEKYESDRAEKALTSAVGTIVDGIECGIFPARPGDPASWGESTEKFENCMFCEYARVCPKSKARLWESKKNSDSALKNYIDLAEDSE